MIDFRSVNHFNGRRVKESVILALTYLMAAAEVVKSVLQATCAELVCRTTLTADLLYTLDTNTSTDTPDTTFVGDLNSNMSTFHLFLPRDTLLLQSYSKFLRSFLHVLRLYETRCRQTIFIAFVLWIFKIIIACLGFRKQ